MPSKTRNWRKDREMTGRRKRSKQLMDKLKEMREYWKLKEEALDRTVWRTRFGRGCGPVVSQNYEKLSLRIFAPRRTGEGNGWTVRLTGLQAASSIRSKECTNTRPSRSVITRGNSEWSSEISTSISAISVSETSIRCYWGSVTVATLDGKIVCIHTLR